MATLGIGQGRGSATLVGGDKQRVVADDGAAVTTRITTASFSILTVNCTESNSAVPFLFSLQVKTERGVNGIPAMALSLMDISLSLSLSHLRSHSLIGSILDHRP